MAGKGQGLALAILSGKPGKKGGAMSDDEEAMEPSGADGGLTAACDDILSAIKADDPDALSSALESWMSLYKSEEASE